MTPTGADKQVIYWQAKASFSNSGNGSSKRGSGGSDDGGCWCVNTTPLHQQHTAGVLCVHVGGLPSASTVKVYSGGHDSRFVVHEIGGGGTGSTVVTMKLSGRVNRVLSREHFVMVSCCTATE